MHYLDSLVPSTWYNDGVTVGGREPYAGHPVRVTILLDCVFALGKCIPQLKMKPIIMCTCIVYYMVITKCSMITIQNFSKLTLMVLSREPDTIWRLSALKATESTSWKKNYLVLESITWKEFISGKHAKDISEPRNCTFGGDKT